MNGGMMNRMRVLRSLFLAIAVVGSVTTSAAPTRLPVTDAPVPASGSSAIRNVPQVQVVVVDRTAGQWSGLAGAVRGWDRSPYVRLSIQPACDPAIACVVVVADRYASRTWTGLTSYVTSRVTLVQIDLTRTWRYPTAAGQGSVLCHELGHALGLNHPGPKIPKSSRGCIAGVGVHAYSPQASNDDLSALSAVVHRDNTLGWATGWGVFAGR